MCKLIQQFLGIKRQASRKSGESILKHELDQSNSKNSSRVIRVGSCSCDIYLYFASPFCWMRSSACHGFTESLRERYTTTTVHTLTLCYCGVLAFCVLVLAFSIFSQTRVHSILICTGMQTCIVELLDIVVSTRRLPVLVQRCTFVYLIFNL